MTAQESDYFLYEGENHSLYGVEGSGLFDPINYGIEAQSISTACWKGYKCGYTINNSKLTVDELYLGIGENAQHKISSGEAQTINGIYPSYCKQDMCAHYTNLGIITEFTGGMVFCKNIIRNLANWSNNVSLIPWPYFYEDTYEAEFERGVLNNIYDYSAELEKLRDSTGGIYPKPRTREKTDIEQLIAGIFKRKYRLRVMGL